MPDPHWSEFIFRYQYSIRRAKNERKSYYVCFGIDIYYKTLAKITEYWYAVRTMIVHLEQRKEEKNQKPRMERGRKEEHEKELFTSVNTITFWKLFGFRTRLKV